MAKQFRIDLKWRRENLQKFDENRGSQKQFIDKNFTTEFSETTEVNKLHDFHSNQGIKFKLLS